MHDQPIIRVNYGFPPLNTEVFVPPKSEPEVSAVASREAAEREAAYLRALNPPRMKASGLPRLKQPKLPSDFQSSVDKLDRQIHERGVAISRDKLLALGKERFSDLLEKDHSARAIQRVIGSKIDLSYWHWVEFAFATLASLTTPIKQRTISEQYAGAGLDREEAAKITGFADLWKVNQNQQTVRDIYAFRDVFDSLVFGQSLLERLGADGRARSHTFCGGHGQNTALFTDWLGTLDGPHFVFQLRNPIWHIISWLANEKTPFPTTLAQDFLDVRAPSKEQLGFCDALFNGFVLGYTGYGLWDYVGRNTRAQMDVTVLEEWRKDLARRYPSVQAFHDELRGLFLKPVASGTGGGHYLFDEGGYRKFVTSNVQMLLNRLSGLLALGIADTLQDTVTARFQSCWVLCEVNSEKAKNFPHNFLPDLVAEKWLEPAFPGHTFYHTAFTIMELPQ